MPNAPEKLFANTLTQTPFSLNHALRFHHGLCWFADKNENLPDAESIWRDAFEASEEEIAFSDNRENVRNFLSQHDFFGIPYKCIRHEDEKEDGPRFGVGLGKTDFSSDLLYAIETKPGGMLAVGRIEPDRLPPYIEDITLFYWATQKFFTHPSRIASGKGRDEYCIEDYEPSREKNLLGPWKFIALRGTSLKDLRSKIAHRLNIIGTPDRLWAAYLRIEEPLLETAVFSLVEAGGEVLDKPLLLFDVSSDITVGTMDKQPPLRLLFFWQ